MERTTQHTPGPWSLNEWPQQGFDITIGAIGTPLIARIPARDVSLNEQKANARLVEAAPDMFLVLQRVRMHRCMFDSDEEFNIACNEVNYAIAKARGQS